MIALHDKLLDPVVVLLHGMTACQGDSIIDKAKRQKQYREKQDFCLVAIHADCATPVVVQHML